MSKRSKAARSRVDEPNVPIMEEPAQPPAVPNAPTVEKTMEAAQQDTSVTQTTETNSPTIEAAATEKPEAPAVETSQTEEAAAVVEAPSPTAKAMAEAEEANARRLIEQAQRNAALAEQAAKEEPTLIELASQGMDTLHDALRRHQEQKVPEYVPPPRTERQMSALQEELEAGRRAQQRAEAQLANRPPPEPPRSNDPFTTPVYRPDNMIPDPMTTGSGRAGLAPMTERSD